MPVKKNRSRRRSTTADGSGKIRPRSEDDFPGINRAQKSKFKPATEVTNEWKAREDEVRDE